MENEVSKYINEMLEPKTEEEKEEYAITVAEVWMEKYTEEEIMKSKNELIQEIENSKLPKQKLKKLLDMHYRIFVIIHNSL